MAKCRRYVLSILLPFSRNFLKLWNEWKGKISYIRDRAEKRCFHALSFPKITLSEKLWHTELFFCVSIKNSGYSLLLCIAYWKPLAYTRDAWSSQINYLKAHVGSCRKAKTKCIFCINVTFVKDLERYKLMAAGFLKNSFILAAPKLHETFYWRCSRRTPIQNYIIFKESFLPCVFPSFQTFCWPGLSSSLLKNENGT
jgi:hypothetical protein